MFDNVTLDTLVSFCEIFYQNELACLFPLFKRMRNIIVLLLFLRFSKFIVLFWSVTSFDLNSGQFFRLSIRRKTVKLLYVYNFYFSHLLRR